MRHLCLMLSVALCLAPIRAEEPFPSLDIGYMGLPQQVSRQDIAPGMQYFRILRGELSPRDYYTLSSGAVTEKKADALIRQFHRLGHTASKEPLAEYGLAGRSLGVAVRLGRFDTIAGAEALQQKIRRAGISTAIRFSAEDGGPTSGPFDISILKVDLKRYRGEIISALAGDKIPGKATTSSIAGRHRALAAVNGGFFAWKKAVGTIGDPAGIAVIDGELVSEATDGRAALVIRNGSSPGLWIAHNVRTRITLKLEQAQWAVSGLNRKTGMVLNCGNRGGEPVEFPAHDVVCTNHHEIVIFDHHFGQVSAPGEGFEFTIDERGKISTVSNILGGEIPVNGYLVQAQGEAATRLRQTVRLGTPAGVSMKIFSDEGEIALAKGLYMVNGGPTLIRRGKIDFTARLKEGWRTDFGSYRISDTFVDKKDSATVDDRHIGNRAGFYHGWAVRRHPRTAVGLTADNILYVAVVYGRQPGLAAGASITEMARVFQALEAEEALNLDGGGSSTMVVGGLVTGPPSDQTGERAIGDALIFK